MNRSIRPRLRPFVAALLLSGAAAVATAAAPLAKTAAPGYYRMPLGAFEVTALSDGVVALDVKTLLTNTTPAQLDAALARSFASSPLPTSVNGFLVNTGSQLVLVDTGAAALFGPTLGKLLANLKASGYQPEQVDAVLITHMHPDHIGGLLADGKRAFPNATVHADQRDADYWLSPANLAQAPAEGKAFFQGAAAALKPYIDAGKFKPFTGDSALLPGIKAVAAPGHTPGHTVYTVESGGQRLVCWGDLMHVGAVQFEQPAVAVQFDVDSKAAVAQRAKVFAQAAKDGAWVAGAHLSFPGIGHLRKQGAGYAFVPVNYAPAP